MHPFADEAEPTRSHNLDALLAKMPDTVEREGLPPGFRMRADAHYVEQLDTPIVSTSRVKEPLPQPPVSPSSSCTTAIEDALRSIATAAGLAAAPSAVMRGGASRLIDTECRRALRLLTVLKVLGGEPTFRSAAVPVLDLLHKVRETIEREDGTPGIRSIRVSAPPDLVAHGSEELLTTAICGAVNALAAASGAVEPRQFDLFGTIDVTGTSVVVVVRERGFSLPQRWAERAFDEPWPVAEGSLALAMLQAARNVAKSHSGSLVIQSRAEATDIRLTLVASPS
jgi:hypothetical protein